MVRVSGSGAWSELDSRALTLCRSNPIAPIEPEAIHVSLSQDIYHRQALHMLGFACLKHRAILGVRRMHFSNGMSSAIVEIADRQGTFDALFVVRRRGVLFILPPPSCPS